MAGNQAGGIAARNTNYRRYGRDFYKKIGAIGGKNGHTGGFYANRELARIVGAKGGRKSKRKQRFIGLDGEGAPQYMKSA